MPLHYSSPLTSLPPTFLFVDGKTLEEKERLYEEISGRVRYEEQLKEELGREREYIE